MADMLPTIDSNKMRDARERTRKLLAQRAQSLIGTVVMVEGDVQRVDAAGERSELVKVGDRLSGPVHLRVDNGRALVRLEDGSDVWLAKGAELDGSAWRKDRRELRLVRGRALAFVAPDRTKPFDITSGRRRARALGTTFEAVVQGDELSVAVLRGRVSMESDTGSAVARAGKRIVAGVAGKPRVERMAKGSVLAAWGDLSASASNSAVKFEAAKVVASARGISVGAGTTLMVLGAMLILALFWSAGRMPRRRFGVVTPAKPVVMESIDRVLPPGKWRTAYAQIVLGNPKNNAAIPSSVLMSWAGQQARDPGEISVLREREKHLYRNMVDLGQVVENITFADLDPQYRRKLTTEMGVLNQELMSKSGPEAAVTNHSRKVLPGWNAERVQEFRDGETKVLVQLEFEAFYHDEFNSGYLRYAVNAWEPSQEK